MRRPERIPIIVGLFKKYPSLLETMLEQELPEDILSDELVEKWTQEPDQRLGQLLINEGLINDDLGNWNIEEDNWLIKNAILEVEDIKFWGNNYGKDMKPLSKTNYILLKDLTTDHIVNILKFYEGRLNNLNSEYLKYFLERIKHE